MRAARDRRREYPTQLGGGATHSVVVICLRLQERSSEPQPPEESAPLHQPFQGLVTISA